jgi:hypothetical protein
VERHRFSCQKPEAKSQKPNENNEQTIKQLNNITTKKMKKFALTVAIVLVMGLGAYAQNGGLLGFGSSSDEYNPNRDGNGLTMPTLPAFGETDDQGATPLGSGIAVLMGLGAAYAFSKKRKD